LVSDAGTPIISDPGFPLIKACREKNISVVPIPGVSAVVAALSVAGMNGKFYFHGFLNDKQGKRIKELTELTNIKATLAFYASPYKLLKTLVDIEDVFGECDVMVCKEITKLHETFFYGTVSEVIADLGESIKGEYVILINNK
jgi:16S rRNA (cytidine1402-2'-O)-methyltransferase